MANQEHLSKLKQGVTIWNQWRSEYPEIIPNLEGANLQRYKLSKINFIEANLNKAQLTLADLHQAELMRADIREANLNKANLSEANLSEANLNRTYLRQTNLIKTNISKTDLVGANLSEAQIKMANFCHSNLCGAFFTRANLNKTDFYRADLSNVDFHQANLINVRLKEACLKNADLSRTLSLKTNFEGSNLTGACVEDWNINHKTNLNHVTCYFIYLKSNWNFNRQILEFVERRPSNKERNFKPGEFTKLFQKMFQTVDLIFLDGIDWKAFLISLDELQNEYGRENISVQSIEKKSKEAFVVHLDVPPEANKAAIENKAIQLYENNIKALEDKYRSELNAKDREIEIYKQKSADILELAKLAASRPITVEAKAVAEHPKFQQNFNAPVYGNAQNVEGNQNIYASEEKQTLAKAAEEIQNLLKQLEQTNPTATVEQQKAYVDAAISPTVKQRCVGALKAGAETGIEEFLDNPYVNVGKAVVKGWLKPE